MPEDFALDYRDPEWVAQRLGIDKNAVYRYLAQGVLPGLRLGRKWLISEASLVEFLKREEREQTMRRRQSLVSHFDKFSRRARGSLSLAAQEALALNHGSITAEHILLGLMKEVEGVAAQALGQVLGKVGADLRDVRRAVVAGMEPAEQELEGEPALGPRAKRVIERAVEEARQLGHDYIGTEHLLAGVMLEEEATSAGVLLGLGATLDGIRAETARVLANLPHVRQLEHKKGVLWKAAGGEWLQNPKHD